MSVATDDEHVISARWVFPVSSPPLDRGTVTVRAGRIVAVEPRGARTPDTDLGNAALIPGLVNAHTHLDLSGLRGKVPPSADFVGWLRAIVAARRSQSPQATVADIRTGLDEALRSGTTLIGDIAAGGASWDALAAAPVWAVCFRELLGLPGPRVAPAWAELVRWAAEHPDTPNCRQAVSPHAPYSVHKAMIEAAARIWPVCIHLAESAAELELIERKTGPFVPFLQDLGVWDPSGLVPSWDWLVWRASRAPSVLFAHGTYLPASTLLPSNATVVYCPRTHAAFNHEPHPYRDLLKRGVRVALGTDSLASNPDLDVLTEARFLFEREPEVPGAMLLRMATLSGAEALGFADQTGSLEAGKSADLVAIPLPERESADPHTLLFAMGTPQASRRTMWRGKWRE